MSSGTTPRALISAHHLGDLARKSPMPARSRSWTSAFEVTRRHAAEVRVVLDVGIVDGEPPRAARLRRFSPGT